jgi:hypothetical protein
MKIEIRHFCAKRIKCRSRERATLAACNWYFVSVLLRYLDNIRSERNHCLVVQAWFMAVHKQ